MPRGCGTSGGSGDRLGIVSLAAIDAGAAEGDVFDTLGGIGEGARRDRCHGAPCNVKPD